MIKIHFFAGLKRTFPKAIEWTLNNDNKSIKQLIAELAEKYPDAAEILSRSRAAINEEFVDTETMIKDQMEVFIIPPSSGG